MRLPAAMLLVTALAALLTTAGRGPAPLQPAPPHGIYFGWASAVGGRLQLLGHPCPAPDAARWISAPLSADASLGLRQANADLGLPLDAGAMLLDDVSSVRAAVGRARWDSVAYACRAGGLGRRAIGAAELVEVGAETTSLTLVARAADPTSPLAGRLLVINGGAGEVVVERLEYAPGRFATGRVRAAAGSRAQIAALEASLAPVASAAEGPAPPSPWDAGYLAPADERALQVRSAEDLDLSLGPGEVALLLVEAASLRRTLTARPVVLYPVVTVADAKTGNRYGAGFATPLVGRSRSWLGRLGG